MPFGLGVFFWGILQLLEQYLFGQKEFARLSKRIGRRTFNGNINARFCRTAPSNKISWQVSADLCL